MCRERLRFCSLYDLQQINGGTQQAHLSKHGRLRSSTVGGFDVFVASVVLLIQNHHSPRGNHGFTTK